MELTAFAAWLNTVFFELDYAILRFYHTLAGSFGPLLTPAMNLITLTAWNGALPVVIALALLCLRKTRKTGLCILLGLALGVIFTNLIVKTAVARPRPYAFDDVLREWWIFVGGHKESDFCFPSGHMTAACAFSTAVILTRGKKWLPWGVLYALLVGASRNYLIVHYPSDVLGGLIFGALAGVLSFLIIRAAYNKWEETTFSRKN